MDIRLSIDKWLPQSHVSYQPAYSVSIQRWAQTTDVYTKISRLMKSQRLIRCLIPLNLWNKSGFIIRGALNLWLRPRSNSCSSRQIAKDPLPQMIRSGNPDQAIYFKKYISLASHLVYHCAQTLAICFATRCIHFYISYSILDLARHEIDQVGQPSW